MKPRDVFKTALDNLFRHKIRTALTTTGVVVGILTIVTMVSLGVGIHREMRRAFDIVGLETIAIYPETEETAEFDPFGEPKRTKPLTEALAQTLQAREDVIAITPYLYLPSGMRINLRIDDQEAQTYAWTPGPSAVPEPFETSPQVLGGVAEPPPEGGSLVIGDSLLEEMGYTAEEMASLVGRQVELVLYAPRGESQPFAFQVAGVIKRQSRYISLAMPDRLRLLEWWYGDNDYLARRGYDALSVRARSLNDAAQIVEWLDNQGYRVRSLKTILDMANKGMILLQTMLGSVGGLALLVASLGIANTMIMAVYERTKEIGILKAVGAAPGQIRTLFVVEASFIGLLGGIVGTLFGWLIGLFLNWLIPIILRWQDVDVSGTFCVVTWWLVAGALAFATLVGLLAGLYPAARAARLAPLDALRYE